MKAFYAIGTAMVMLAFAAPANAFVLEDRGPSGPNDAPDVRCEHFSPAEVAAHHGLMTETYPTATPGMTVTVHLICMTETLGEVSPLTDCTSNAYSLTGWYWAAAYNAQWDTRNSYGLSASTVLSSMNAASEVWDTAVSANIFGSMTEGGNSKNIRRQDFVNQQGFKKLGGGGTIAVTYTWSYSDGRAAESDAAYNTFYQWGVNGESNKMDLQGIGAHEMGHTFGMGHTTTAAANQCLTMYPYGDFGMTHQRTLGDGDITGINVVY